MEIATLEQGFMNYWSCGPFTTSVGTDKLAYREIAGKNFQFRKVGYLDRTTLVLELMAVGKNLSGVLATISTMSQDDDEAEAEIVAKVLPELIGALSTPGLQDLLNKLCATAFIDSGTGTFESLDNEFVAERTFGEDITLQVPVAITAAIFNLGNEFKKLKNIL